MLKTYRAVFRAPGTAAFCAAGFVMRLPISIYPIALVLIVSGRSGHYGFAGVLSACYILGGAPGNPVLARLVDRYGQRRLIPPATAAHVASVVGLAVLFEVDAPDWTLIAPTFVAGFAYLSVGSLVRARWSKALAGTPELTTAYSLESTLDELIFVVGPLIATLIATQVEPTLVLFLSVLLVSAGASWLWIQRDSEPAPHPLDAPHLASALRSPGMPLLTMAAAAMGALFASAEVTMVAFCGQHGQRTASGVVLASMAFGSGVAGFTYGARRWRTDLLVRFRLHAVVFAVLPFLFLAATTVPVLAVCAFLVGLGIAPTLITSFGLIERIVPGAALTEGLAWLITGLNLGYGAGAASVGGIADAHGARLAFSVTIASGLLMGGLALALYRRLRAPAAASEPVAVG
jgi:MFS family permease